MLRKKLRLLGAGADEIGCGLRKRKEGIVIEERKVVEDLRMGGGLKKTKYGKENGMEDDS